MSEIRFDHDTRRLIQRAVDALETIAKNTAPKVYRPFRVPAGNRPNTEAEQREIDSEKKE